MVEGPMRSRVAAANAAGCDFPIRNLPYGVFSRAGEPLPPSDVVTGFGLVDWLEREECLRFFRNIKDRTFMFSYSEQDGSFDEIIHHTLRCTNDGICFLGHHRLNELNEHSVGSTKFF